MIAINHSKRVHVLALRIWSSLWYYPPVEWPIMCLVRDWILAWTPRTSVFRKLGVETTHTLCVWWHVSFWAGQGGGPGLWPHRTNNGQHFFRSMVSQRVWASRMYVWCGGAAHWGAGWFTSFSSTLDPHSFCFPVFRSSSCVGGRGGVVRSGRQPPRRRCSTQGPASQSWVGNAPLPPPFCRRCHHTTELSHYHAPSTRERRLATSSIVALRFPPLRGRAAGPGHEKAGLKWACRRRFCAAPQWRLGAVRTQLLQHYGSFAQNTL